MSAKSKSSFWSRARARSINTSSSAPVPPPLPSPPISAPVLISTPSSTKPRNLVPLDVARAHTSQASPPASGSGSGSPSSPTSSLAPSPLAPSPLRMNPVRPPTQSGDRQRRGALALPTSTTHTSPPSTTTSTTSPAFPASIPLFPAQKYSLPRPEPALISAWSDSDSEYPSDADADSDSDYSDADYRSDGRTASTFSDIDPSDRPESEHAPAAATATDTPAPFASSLTQYRLPTGSSSPRRHESPVTSPRSAFREAAVCVVPVPDQAGAMEARLMTPPSLRIGAGAPARTRQFQQFQQIRPVQPASPVGQIGLAISTPEMGDGHDAAGQKQVDYQTLFWASLQKRDAGREDLLDELIAAYQ